MTLLAEGLHDEREGSALAAGAVRCACPAVS